MAILERRLRREGFRPGKESRIEQHYRISCGRVPTSYQTAGRIRRLSQQTEEAYPNLSNLKRELERAQRERDKANFDRDGAKLERDQANRERDQAILEKGSGEA